MTALPRIFIAGTDTGVGKTWVSCRLLRSLRAAGCRAAGFKPVLCGQERDDAEALWQASGSPGDLGLDDINPAWLPVPVAPLAAPLAGQTFPLDRSGIAAALDRLASARDCVVIEGAGGWEMPLAPGVTLADLAVDFAAPVLLVAANRLGALSHARLAFDAIGRRGLPCLGVVLNEVSPPDSRDLARRTNLEALRLSLPGLPVEPLGWGGAEELIDRGTLERLGISAR